MLPPLRYLTADLPGVGGRIKQRPEDFLVDEQPAYEPCGQGEHLYLFIEKTGLTTTDVVRSLARAFDVRRSDVGYAGMKDKHAITRQVFSVYTTRSTVSEGQAAETLQQDERIKVLWADRHRNKLRLGHLAGNRFSIRIRDVSPTDALNVKRMLDQLAASGVPNYLGHQRFGIRLNNHVLGRLLVKGEYQAFLDAMLGDPSDTENPALKAGREAYDRGAYGKALEHWPRGMRHDRQALDALRQGKAAKQTVAAIDRKHLEFLLTAMQSDVFNRVLDRRLADGTFDRLLPGDLAWKHENQAVFRVDEATAELENSPEGRIAQMAISPSGPMWGTDMMQPEGVPGQIEQDALHAAGLTEADLAANPNPRLRLGGTRRPLRVPLIDPDISGGVDEHGSYIRVAFELPRGAFATTVLRELMKADVADVDEGHD